MRIIISIFLFLFTAVLISNDVLARSSRSSSSDVYVNWYYRSNWTYVQPHYRSAPDGIVSNNYWCIDSWICGWLSSTSSNYSVYNDPLKQAMCSKKYPWTVYRYIDDMCICENWGDFDSKYWKCLTGIEKNQIKTESCSVRFPWTYYSENSDMCVCSNWWDYYAEYWTCLSRNEVNSMSRVQCATQYPWTTYNEKLNQCICTNGGKYDESYWICLTSHERVQIKTESCSSRFPWTVYEIKEDACICPEWWDFNSKEGRCPEVKKCNYTDWTKASIWDYASDNLVCQSNWTWNCEKGYVWNTSERKCISYWDNICKREYGTDSVFTGKKNGKKYICKCINGTSMTDWMCLLK